MTTPKEKCVKKGFFKGMTNVCAKKYLCQEGELTLTENNLIVSCGDHWSKTIPVIEVRLEGLGNRLSVRTIWYNKLLFTLTVDQAEEWEKALGEIISDHMKDMAVAMADAFDFNDKETAELSSLLDIQSPELKKLYLKVKKQRQFEIRNIRFNLDIQDHIDRLKNRKLRAYLTVHCYVAWYEWTKKLLYEIYKTKKGKGPADDRELQRFLTGYPHINFLSTETWGIKANDIRNCVAHEKFYYDYLNSEIVFQIHKKEKRLKLVELRLKLFQLSSYYPTILNALRQKIASCGLDKSD